MKIILLGGLTSGSGGMETVFKKFNQLLKNDFSIEFVTFIKEITTHNLDWTKEINLTIVKSPNYLRMVEKYNYKKNLIQIIDSNKPDLIIAYDYIGCDIASLALKKTKYKCNLISWCHFSFNIFREKHKQEISKADYHLVLCDEIKDQMINYGIDSNKIDIIYNPVSPKKQIITSKQENNHSVIFLYVGRVQYAGQKNIQEMFLALSQLKYPFKLHVVGDGTQEEILKLKDLSIKLNLVESIKWHGWQKKPWDYVIDNIKNVDSLILSSTYEGLPMVLIEAISYGIFCISSNCPTGPNDIILEKNGLFYESRNIDDFVTKLNHFATMDKPSKDEIKSSINKFYDDQYQERLINLIRNKYILKGYK